MKRALLILLLAQHGTAGITVDSGPSSYTTGPATSLTFAHTTGGTNGLMSLQFTYFLSPDSGTPTATYNGDALTLDRTVRVTAFAQYSTVWHLVAPDVGTHNVVVSHASGNGTLIAHATTWNGVDQESPVDAAEGATGTGTTASKTYTSATGDVVWDTVMLGNYAEIAPTAGQTEIAEDNVGASSTDIDAVSYEDGAASLPLSWSLGASVEWFEQGYSINPAAEAAGASPVAIFGLGTAGTGVMTE